jgi:hypothetical protein
MQGFNINAVDAPPNTVAGQIVPPTGSGGWGMNCQPGIDGSTPDSDMFNDLLGNIFRVLQVAGIIPRANSYDDLIRAIQSLIGKSEANTGASIDALHKALAQIAFTADYNDLINKPVIPAAQVNADWNAIGGPAYIYNKPDFGGFAPRGNYVQGADGHLYQLTWDGTYVDLYVDGTPQGGVLTTSNFQFPAIGAIGCAFLVEQGPIGGIGTRINGLTWGGNGPFPGTWESRGGGQTSNNNWYLWVRIA